MHPKPRYALGRVMDCKPLGANRHKQTPYSDLHEHAADRTVTCQGGCYPEHPSKTYAPVVLEDNCSPRGIRAPEVVD